MRVPADEKERARALAEKCGLSMTGLWRSLLAQADSEPFVGWRPVLPKQQRQAEGAQR